MTFPSQQAPSGFPVWLESVLRSVLPRGCRRSSGRGIVRGRRAFSLIEIMVSLVIVSIIVMLVGNIFDQASDSWYAGMGSAEMNNAGRAALDLIATELTQAFAGRVENADIPGAVSNILFIQDGEDPADILFTCFNQTPDNTRRGVRGVRYYRDGADLKREIYTESFNPYRDIWLGGSTHVLLPNVEKFRIKLYNNDLTPYVGGFPLETNALPPCADIMIEVVPDSAKTTLSRMAYGSDPYLAYRAANVRTFSTRVYFRNRMGFLPR